MTDHAPTRRGFIGGTALAALGLAQAGRARAAADPSQAPDAPFTYEVQRSEAKWRAMLTEHEYAILREGGTEEQRSSEYWDSEAEGMFCCKGCNLTLFDSRWQTYPGPGWVFFRQSEPNAVLTDIDASDPYGGSGMQVPDALALIEVHCRRCGSHLGHILTYNNATLYCVNGASLTFRPAEA